MPTVAQWDDHETCNNWYPGEVLDDDRYTERRCDVLAARGRRAWQEYMPVPVSTFVDRRGDGYASGRIYRKVPRGPHLDLFVLDMRSYRGGNDTFRVQPQGILGPDQERWLTESVIASPATWKVISADLPLSIPSTHDDDLDGPCNGDDGKPMGREPELARILSAWQRAGVTGVVFITADVHYTAAHHYSPDRAAFTEFDPFWEFVSGPLAAEDLPAQGRAAGPDLRPAGRLLQGQRLAAPPVPTGRQPVLRPPRHRRRRGHDRDAPRGVGRRALDEDARAGLRLRTASV